MSEPSIVLRKVERFQDVRSADAGDLGKPHWMNGLQGEKHPARESIKELLYTDESR